MLKYSGISFVLCTLLLLGSKASSAEDFESTRCIPYGTHVSQRSLNEAEVSASWLIPNGEPYAREIIIDWGDKSEPTIHSLRPVKPNELGRAIMDPVKHLYQAPGDYTIKICNKNPESRCKGETNFSIKVGKPPKPVAQVHFEPYGGAIVSCEPTEHSRGWRVDDYSYWSICQIGRCLQRQIVESKPNLILLDEIYRLGFAGKVDAMCEVIYHGYDSVEKVRRDEYVKKESLTLH